MRSVCLRLFLIVVLAMHVRCDEPPQFFRDFLAKFNRGEMAEARWVRWFSTYGPLEIRDVQAMPPAKLTIWTRGTDSAAWLGFVIDPKEPNADMTVLSLNGAPPRASMRDTTKRTAAHAKDEIARYLEHLAAGGRFSGTVIVARSANVLYRGAFGKNITIDTPFSIASVGKVFTAVAIAQLAEAGKLKFDDPIAKFIPDHPSKATIHQLLTHTGGLARVEGWMRDRKDRSLEELVRATIAEPEFAPGEQIRYNNEAWLILGRIVERVSGLSFDDYLRRRVFAPAGMKHTGNWAFAEAANAARPMTHWRPKGDDEVFDRGAPVDAEPFLRIRGTPAGGTISSAPDLHAFLTALWSGKLVSKKMLAGMTTPHASEKAPPGLPQRPAFGYGFEIDADPPRIGKSGGALGVSASIAVYPKNGYQVIVVSNSDSAGSIAAARVGEIVAAIE